MNPVSLQSRGPARREFLVGTAAALLAGTLAGVPGIAAAQADRLPSWNEGEAKEAILSFAQRVGRAGSSDFVPESERIAVFDNDGTLWSEQPFYFQLAFALDRIRSLAGADRSLASREPYASALSGDPKRIAALGESGLLNLVGLSHGGVSTEAFEQEVLAWLKTARHPRFDRPYTELVFQPMLELLAYLRGSGFKIFIVSGGGVDFLRPWAEEVYGIPREQIVGSSLRSVFRLNGDRTEIYKLPELEFIDDGPGKPVGIHRFIGRRPIFAAGNSDGDLEMLQWTTLADGARFGLIVHHTDAEREWAYDRESSVGRLSRALDEAPRRGWTVVDMKKDWKRVYPFQ
ncbi:MAG: HAD family hydrolase [Reyranellaceae bacterium]